jgi:SRSO17 transposase
VLPIEVTMMERNGTDWCPLDEQDVQMWRTVYWAEVERRIGPVFARSETRTRALAYLTGLLSPAERKNSWQVAEIIGETTPYGVQHLLGRAEWNPDDLRDRLRSYVVAYLADDHAVGVLDETGFLKKGAQSVGVARQYCGTAGRVENCQIGVFLSYASVHGHTLLDRELYLPTSWIDDPDRGQHAGVPTNRAFATKPELARQILARTAAAGVRFAAIAGDSVYGDDRPLRQWLEAHQQPYVLAISPVEQLWVGHETCTHATLLARLAALPWERHSCGEGSQGPRWYDWQRLELNDPPQAGFQRWVVFRRSCTDPSKVTAYRAFGPVGTPLAAQARVVGQRWRVEESIQTGKSEVGLDEYEVRSWTGWYRHITLAMWAQAFLSVIRAEQGTVAVPKKRALRSRRPSSLAAFKRHRGLRSA